MSLRDNKPSLQYINLIYSALRQINLRDGNLSVKELIDTHLKEIDFDMYFYPSKVE